MLGKEFFYKQYNKINWSTQEKTQLNYPINKFIIEEIILKNKNSSIKLFDIGFGTGFFFRMLSKALPKRFEKLVFAGCEPSKKNYDYFVSKKQDVDYKVKLETFNKTFQKTKLTKEFDFVTAIFVFPIFLIKDFDKIEQKINSLLKKGGKFVFVITDYKFIKKRAESGKETLLEKTVFSWGKKKYEELLTCSTLPGVGKIIDYNREEKFYLDLLKKNGFKLSQKKKLVDHGFICKVYSFEKI